ncbi:glycosyltransferase family 4 protein [Candidatus Falkowbacteria bacterium]|uniref:Glycosyltransferase family 1 protein n=1 Tax=Candidatus Buchananbacteria bacterium CG10_big_fil_rev_8_21_14_0_10_33_19 TaxID=1974525 RepID=A0A2H0W5R4_9BACT|nr:glycosyltransferase family 4 protein [Candidatus Falkowbacteria bacterium]PIS05951.1 MAG: hypothetical protein COT80_04255 [Candidatus Buchananbacteria bacterium CG10_big_fil_rev_8_21_14_0_10_33_19]
MKKTLLVTYFFPPQIGGIENYYLNLCANLPSDKIVVLTQENSNTDEFDNQQNYKIHRTNFFGGFLSPRWRHLKGKIKKIKEEEGIEQIIFGHFHPLNILGNYLDLPYYIFVHGTDVKQVRHSLWQRIIFKKVYNDCKKIVANSNYIASEVESIVKDKNKVIVIHPGINYQMFSQKSDQIESKRRELNFKSTDLIILSMGRLVKQKNFQTIIKLFPDLLIDFPNLKYIIAGDGPERDQLMKLVYNLGLKNNIKFVGRVDNNDHSKKVYYQLADLFVSVSSIAEGFGITYLEAQASGLPIVASRIGGSSEAVASNQTGILVDPNDLGQIKEAVHELLNNNNKRQEYAVAGQKRALDKFDWPQQVNKIKEIL